MSASTSHYIHNIGTKIQILLMFASNRNTWDTIIIFTLSIITKDLLKLIYYQNNLHYIVTGALPLISITLSFKVLYSLIIILCFIYASSKKGKGVHL